MKALRMMTMVVAVGSTAMVMGCKDKNTDASENGDGATTTTSNGGSTATASGPQATLDQFIEAMQLADFDTAIELCDESLGQQKLYTAKATWDKALDNVDNEVPQAEIALQMTRAVLLGPWEGATGTVSQTEGDFAQATVIRSGGADPVMLTLNKVDGTWLIVAPAELFGGGSPPVPGTPPAPAG